MSIFSSFLSSRLSFLYVLKPAIYSNTNLSLFFCLWYMEIATTPSVFDFCIFFSRSLRLSLFSYVLSRSANEEKSAILSIVVILISKAFFSIYDFMSGMAKIVCTLIAIRIEISTKLINFSFRPPFAISFFITLFIFFPFFVFCCYNSIPNHSFWQILPKKC